MSTKTVCRSCGQAIPSKQIYRVKIQLVNAVDPADPSCLKEDDFHFECAASVFSAFDGRDLHPQRKLLSARLKAAAAGSGEPTSGRLMNG